MSFLPFVGFSIALSACGGAPSVDDEELTAAATAKGTSDSPTTISQPTQGTGVPTACGTKSGLGVRDEACAALMPDAGPPPPPMPIKASLAITRHPDSARWTNCLKIQVNKGPEVDLGCNKGTLVPTVQVDALSKPGCNEVRLILYSNGAKNRTTESADNVANDFRITRTGPNAFAIKCNDNRDNDFNDLNLDISSADASLSIENTSFKCQP